MQSFYGYQDMFLTEFDVNKRKSIRNKTIRSLKIHSYQLNGKFSSVFSTKNNFAKS